ncbi:unnamed protein product [Vicia faba]|uniref:Protein SAR DEFICIENT 1 n=1 Tax=Vicia faba TaxID=3906 RepID=A0AAV0ZBB9_VICFA|nr:unnamed protein product [Vicia faba]
MKPTLASVIEKAVKMENMQKLLAALEPFLQRVVSEEVDKTIRKCFPCSINRSPSLRIQTPNHQQSTLQLSFNKKVPLTIFTGSRILDIEGNPMNIILVEKTNNNQIVQTSLPYPIKLEIVVLDGDFPLEEKEDWSSEEFNRKIVKERSGKRPLLSGEMNLTMRDGVAVIGDIDFTDNSSWIKSRKFRVAVKVKVIPHGNNQSVRIQEAMTDAFVVKDHRGELYKKHYPPMLDDDLWRLEKIGKGGAFHTRMTSEGIKTVQDFLKLAVIDSEKLRKILGVGMSDRMWEVTLKHAMTCDMGSKIYIYRQPQVVIYLNPICKLIKANINGHEFSTTGFSQINKSYIDKLVKEAYTKWDELEEIDVVLNDNIALLTQDDQIGNHYPNNNQASVVTTLHQNIASYVPSNKVQMGASEWSLNQGYATTSFTNDLSYDFSCLQSDGEITPSSSSLSDFDGVTRHL